LDLGDKCVPKFTSISGKDITMDIDELRSLQAPLKEGYRRNPERAVIATRAEGILDDEEIVCRMETFAGTTMAGLHPATGGDGSKACSADMLMEALVACAGVTMKAVATAMRIPLTRAKVIAEGSWDARGTLGVDRAAPVGLKAVGLTFEIDSPAGPEKIEKLVQLTERYCVIYQTLANPPKLTSHLK
jgi:uncharacterized OsmC-like protein